MEKVALITGGSSGLGKAFAKILAYEGYSLVLIARNKEKLNKTAEELSSITSKILVFSADVTNNEQLESVALALKDVYSKIDLLIINAGIVSVKLLSEFSASTLTKDIEVDLIGAIKCVYHFQTFLEKNSKVLFISSALGLMGLAGYSTYCAAKAGLINFAEAYRREVLSKGINVYVACPADVDTPQYHQELKEQPLWMKQKNSVRKLHSADFIAKKILSNSRGNNKFLILPTFDVKFLYWITKILPRALRDWLLDRVFPKP